MSSTIAKHVNFDKVLNGIRTSLASVISKIDSSEKFKLDGSMSPELLFRDAESQVDKELEDLEALKDRILGTSGLVEVLRTLETPPENTGTNDE